MIFVSFLNSNIYPLKNLLTSRVCKMCIRDRLMIDMEICIDQIANMRVEQMNLVLEATRQTVMSKYAPGEDDLYMRTLELGHINRFVPI